MSELAAAYALSKATTPIRRDDAAINEALGKGKIVLVLEYSVYCPFTDGFIGYARELVTVYDSMEDAEGADQWGNDEGGQRLLFPAPRTVKPVQPVEDWEIPF